MKLVKTEDKLIMILEGNVCEGCGEFVLEANTVDAAVEKHIPVVKFENDTLEVTVGSVLHPMSAEHNIAWILVETKEGHLFKKLNVDEEPIATFKINKEEVVNVYAYCNLHGLWKA